jgi:hypothetical protein
VSAPSRLLSAILDAPRVLRPLATRLPLRLAIFGVLALVAKWPLLTTAAWLNDFRDAHYFTLFEETARTTVLKFHQIPLWDPYYCGGIPALGTPSARFASPTFLLTMVFGTLRADGLIAFGMTIIGLEGAFRYLRARGAPSVGALLAAPIFALGGFFARAAALDWINFFGFELVPWAALGLRHALRGDRRGAVMCAVALGWMIGFGGTYAGPLMVLVGVFELLEVAIVRAVPHVFKGRAGLRQPRRWGKLGPIVAMGALAGALALAMSAFRLWPVAENLAAAPRILGGAPGNTVRMIWGDLFGGMNPARGEMLVGILAVPVILAAILRRRTIPLVLTGWLWLWLAMGYKVKPSLFSMLRVIPPYTMLRYPERFLALFALAAAVGAAIGLGRVVIAARTKRRLRFAPLLATVLLGGNVVLLVVNDYAEVNGRTLAQPPIAREGDFRQARGNRWVAAFYPAMSRGTLSCFDDYNIAQSAALRGDLPNEEYVEDGSGKVTRDKWTPNAIDLTAELARPGRVIVNQNWHPGWKASVGEVVDDKGRLAVNLPAGTHSLHLSFLPRSAVGGILTSVFALVCAVLIWRRAHTWRTHALLSVAPFAGALFAFVFMREPARPPAELVAPSGEAVLAEAPPLGAKPLGVHFAGGVVLEAVVLNVGRGYDSSSVSIELDWKRGPEVPRGLGIFVHVTADGAETVNVDHVMLSSVVAFENAPAKTTLRDISAPAALPNTRDRKKWTVKVGLWRARAGGARVPVEDANGAETEKDAVVVGTFDAP